MGNFGFVEVRSSRRLSWKSVSRSTTNCASLGSLGPDTFHRAFLKIQTLTVNLETWIYAPSVYDESWIDAQFNSWLKLKIIRFLLCPSEMERVERCRWWLIWNLMRQWEGSEMQGAAHFQSSSNSWLVNLHPTGGACSRHSRRRISTTSQHILHLLDQFHRHRCPGGRPKNHLMHFSGHTFTNSHQTNLAAEVSLGKSSASGIAQKPGRLGHTF